MYPGKSSLCLPLSLRQGWGYFPQHSSPTFLTVGLPIFHVEEAVPEGLLAGCTDEAGGVPCLSQGMHHFLRKRASAQDRKVRGREGPGLDFLTRPQPLLEHLIWELGRRAQEVDLGCTEGRPRVAEEGFLLMQYLLDVRFYACLCNCDAECSHQTWEGGTAYYHHLTKRASRVKATCRYMVRSGYEVITRFVEGLLPLQAVSPRHVIISHFKTSS